MNQQNLLFLCPFVLLFIIVNCALYIVHSHSGNLKLHATTILDTQLPSRHTNFAASKPSHYINI